MEPPLRNPARTRSETDAPEFNRTRPSESLDDNFRPRTPREPSTDPLNESAPPAAAGLYNKPDLSTQDAPVMRAPAPLGPLLIDDDMAPVSKPSGPELDLKSTTAPVVQKSRMAAAEHRLATVAARRKVIEWSAVQLERQVQR